MGQAGGSGPKSGRVVGGWVLLDCGAGSDADGVWLYRSEPGTVKIALQDEERVIMRVVSNEVLAHVLRVQGYAVERDAEAAE